MIDLASDTATRPGKGMLAAMTAAPLGDEQRGEDPTTTALCEQIADLLGMETAVFLPSGTMCNQIAFLVHCQPGDEIIAAANSHIVRSEAAGAAALAGAQIQQIVTETGIFTPADIAAAQRPARRNAPRSRLVSVEQTTNFGGGRIWPVETLQAIIAHASETGLAVHMDGARLLNATTALNMAPTAMTGGLDSVWLDLSKGLGCPIGAVLAGNAGFIEAAWHWKHRLGGAMRQSGILAAAGLYALDNNLDALARDHDNARMIAAILSEVPGLQVEPAPVETNILFVDVAETGLRTDAISAGLAPLGIRFYPDTATRLRIVTHLDVSRDQARIAARALAEYCLNAGR